MEPIVIKALIFMCVYQFIKIYLFDKFFYTYIENTQSNEPYYIGTWKSDINENIAGTMKVPQLIIDKPGKVTAYLTYDDSSMYKPGVTLEITIESHYKDELLIYTSTISNGFFLNILAGSQIVTYIPIEKSTSCINGTYRSIRPYDYGKFTITLSTEV